MDVPWYYRNDHLHRGLKIPMIRQEIQRFAERHETRLHSHVNTEELQLLDNTNLNRRLHNHVNTEELQLLDNTNLNRRLQNHVNTEELQLLDNTT
jgi:hypothetical protein